MLSSGFGFPTEDFLACLRSNRVHIQQFLTQANSLNTHWIYQMIKHCHNIILDIKQLPATKLAALETIRDIMETSQVPCIDLIEVYILPIIYEVAIEKPQEHGDRRGVNFFQQQGKSTRIPNIQQTGIKFVALCTQLLCAGAMTKTKRTFGNQQLNQKSDYVDYYQKLKKYGIPNTPTSHNQIKHFSEQFLKNGRQRYLRNLQNFDHDGTGYCQYFVTKIIESVESDANPLFAVTNANSVSNQLDMRKLLRQGNIYITSPLIDQLLMKLQHSDNFFVKKNCLSLLSDFFKSGDLEAIVKICSHDCIQNIGTRMAQVSGAKGSAEGQNIYPEIKGQRDAKRKFFVQYLKSLEIFAKCIDNQKLEMDGSNKIMDLYKYFKQNKFEFPQNLMAKRIQSDFNQNLQHNKQRNGLLLRRLSEQSSIAKQNRRQNTSQISVSKIQLSQMNHNIQQCLQQLLKIPQGQNEIDKRMNKLIKFRQNFDMQADKLDGAGMKQEEVEWILDNGLELTRNIQRLEPFYKRYKNRQINFNELVKQHALIMKDYEDESENNIEIKNDINLRHSKEITQQVISSYAPQLARQPMHQTSPIQLSPNNMGAHVNMPTTQNNPAIFRQQTFGTPSMASTGNPIQLNSLAVTQDNQHKMVTTNYSQPQRQSAENAYQLTTPNFKPLYPVSQPDHINQESVLNQVTSSIMSNKDKQQDKISRLSKNELEDRPSYSKISGGSSLKQKMEKRKEDKRASQLSLPKQPQQPQFILSQPAQISRNSNSQQIKNNIPRLPSIVEDSSSQHVEYVDYMAPPSFKMTKHNPIMPALVSPQIQTANNNGRQVYAMTAPNHILDGRESRPEMEQNKSAPNMTSIGNEKMGVSGQGEQRLSKQMLNINEQMGKNYNSKRVITTSGYKGSGGQRMAQYKTARQEEQDNKLYNMYKTELASRQRYVYQQEQQQTPEQSQDFAQVINTLPNPDINTNINMGLTTNKNINMNSSNNNNNNVNIMPVVLNGSRGVSQQEHSSISSSLSHKSNNTNNIAKQEKQPIYQRTEQLTYYNNNYNNYNNNINNINNNNNNQLNKSSPSNDGNKSTVRPYYINNNNSNMNMNTNDNNINNNNSSNNNNNMSPIANSANHNYYVNSNTHNYNPSNMGNSRLARSRDTPYDHDEDVIRQPDIQPLDNSYYGVKQIQAQVKNSIKPQFKHCFQIHKQMLPSPIRTSPSNSYGVSPSGSNIGNSNATIKTSTPKHQEYLIAKLRRQYQRQTETDTKLLHYQVLQLKTDSSRLRNQVRNKQNNFLLDAPNLRRSNSRQSSSSSVVAFSNSKSHSNSPSAFRPSQKSKMGISTVSAIVCDGAQVNQNPYTRFLSDFHDQKIKKSCLRNKALLVKNQICQVGCTFRKAQDMVKMTIYFTPSFDIANCSYSIAKQPNLDIESYCKDFTSIPANKQVKIQVSAYLKNLPYNLPIMNIKFIMTGQQRNLSFYLPLTFNKFVNVNQIDAYELQRAINQNKRNMLKTVQFKVNQKIIKQHQILQYFPNLTQLNRGQGQNTIRYGGRCSFKNNNFVAIITTKGKQETMIQAIPENESPPAQFYMLTLQTLMQA